MAMGSAWEDDFGMSPIQEYRHWEDYRRLKAENAKLRELVQGLWFAAQYLGMNPDGATGSGFARQMRELGIDVTK
jgi:hypothetical protein